MNTAQQPIHSQQPVPGATGATTAPMSTVYSRGEHEQVPPEMQQQDSPPHMKKQFDYGGNPYYQMHAEDRGQPRFTAFGGALQPGLFQTNRKLGNPAPLGLCAFALTTFMLSLINIHTRGVAVPSMVLAAAFAYGGLVQLLAGMWEMAVGNTFGATALSSYGGFWIAFAIILTPGFSIAEPYGGLNSPQWNNAFGFFLFGWFIFTTLMLLSTLRSTVAFFTLFLMLDMCFLMLAIGHILNGHEGCIVAGGWFGLLAAFAAWYNALAGLLDMTNSFFIIPVAHFPWSARNKLDKEIEAMS